MDTDEEALDHEYPFRIEREEFVQAFHNELGRDPTEEEIQSASNEIREWVFQSPDYVTYAVRSVIQKGTS